MATPEGSFKTKLINDLEHLFPGCVILKNDPEYIQGIPDMMILFRGRWAALETKAASRSRRQPNQPYWIDRLNDMSYAAFVYPGNKEQILDDLQSTFQFGR